MDFTMIMATQDHRSWRGYFITVAIPQGFRSWGGGGALFTNIGYKTTVGDKVQDRLR